MAAVALLTTSKRLDVVNSYIQYTLPAGEDLEKGTPVRIDTTTGKWVKAKADTAANARVFGITVKRVKAGEGVTVIRRGILHGFVLTALAYDADLYLATAGGVDTAAGTVSKRLGFVSPVFGNHDALVNGADKLFYVDIF